MTRLKLLGKSTSINVRKVLWTCAEIGLHPGQDFDHEEWGSGHRPTDTDEFRAMNPNALVPVIVDGDGVLWESNTICRYLATRHDRPDLLPTEPAQRARVEMWMDWQATELNNAWRYAFMALVRRSPAHADPHACAESVQNWHRHMAMVDAQLARTGAFMAGPTLTLADVVIGLSVNRWMMTPMARPDFPSVIAYYDRLSQRSGYQAHGRNGTP